MSEGDEEEGRGPSRRRWPRVLLALLFFLALALAGLWLERKPLATRYADRFLAAKHVPARYRIADLGLGRQRLVDVVIGDPADPDLVADWLEARTAVGLDGPYLTGVSGGHVRVRARLANGRLSLGSIDRLLPQGKGGKPFALPALALDVEDLRARIETPWGVVGAKLTGRGRLDGGFDGRLALAAAQLGGACAVQAPRAVLRVRTLDAALVRREQAVRLEGSAELARLACAGASAGYANANGRVTLTLGDRLRWAVDTDIAATDLRHPAATAARLAGHAALAGEGGRASGRTSLAARNVTAAGGRAERVMLSGAVLRDPARGLLAFTGPVALTGASWRGADLRALASAGQGTPVGPLLRRAAAATASASQRFDAQAAVYLALLPQGPTVEARNIALSAASGARVALASGNGVRWSRTGWLVDGSATIAGGGLPQAAARLVPAGPGAVEGTATVRLYAAEGAALALTPVRFAWRGPAWRVATVATVTGPLAGGRVEALTLPIDARGSGGAVTVGGGCLPVSWRQVAVGGLLLDPAAVRLCGEDALLRIAKGRIEGGARLGPTRLAGRLGATPLTLAVDGARLRLADRSFALTGVAARLGQPGRMTRLDATAIEGAIGPAGVAGDFARAGGQIGAVPLILSEAAGRWRFADGALTVTGGLTVSDAQADHPRFRPLPVRDVALTLADGRIEATGRLLAPTTDRLVATVRLTHDLARGAGGARFAVPGLLFDSALQPDQLTPVTFGVIADVRGTVTGEGAIDWSLAGVTSTGRFHTDGADLAAAFGPVQGIAGTIRFTDLLGLQSAPGQQLTVRSVNPGILVTDGVLRFQTLPNARVQVEGARWPFAGGELTLLPTLLDFGQPAERRMTFRVRGMAADRFLQQFDFPNLQATGIFDGELPMVFDQSGGRIDNGRLTVRPGGGTIAYVGPISQKNLGFWGNFAFQALKSLRYRSLGIVMNGPLAGEMVTEVRFAGVTQGAGAKSNFLIRRLQRLPIMFNIRIRAPFRGLLDATSSFYDPEQLIRRNLPALIEQERRRRPIQPPASETVP